MFWICGWLCCLGRLPGFNCFLSLGLRLLRWSASVWGCVLVNCAYFCWFWVCWFVHSISDLRVSCFVGGFDWFLVCVIGWWLGCRFVGVSLGFGMLVGGLWLVVFVILRLVLVVTCGGVAYLLWLT